MLYGFIRFGLIPISLIGWVFYQLFKKKKSLSALQPDILMIVVLITVWVFIYSQFLD
ncbi:MAG: hypothetical protein QM726_21810 [Chitinophagaceae bacterium]